jgi:gamma-glutamylcyclotransferase
MTARTARAAQAVPSGRPETLYFAYGSNLHLAQMAKRCPESRYIGRGELLRYRWHINQRGYANVIPDSNCAVSGLCYLLSPNDEARLDRNEGVPTAYEKKSEYVVLHTARADLVGRKVTEILSSDVLSAMAESRVREDSRRMNSTNSTGQHAPPRPREAENGEYVQALVYVSPFTEDGEPREEYIHRMNYGIADAVALGMSERYVNERMRKVIPANHPRQQGPKKLRRREDVDSADESEAAGPTDRRPSTQTFQERNCRRDSQDRREGHDPRQPATGRELMERGGPGDPRGGGPNGAYRRGQMDPHTGEFIPDDQMIGVSQEADVLMGGIV